MLQLPLRPKAEADYVGTGERELLAYFRDELGWGWNLHARATFQFLIEARTFSIGKTVLDAGAGFKRFAPFFSTAGKYLTVEHPSGIAMKNMDGIAYDFVAELDGEPFCEPCSIDAIYCHSVLEHIENPDQFFANCMAMLRPGGRLYLHVPFIYQEHETPFDFNRLSRYGLRSRLTTAGFGVAALVPSSNAFYGSSHFLVEAMSLDLQAGPPAAQRGWVLDFRLRAARKLLRHLIRWTADQFDDEIRDNPCPVGWLAIAEKPP